MSQSVGLIGLASVHSGAPLPKGVQDEGLYTYYSAIQWWC